MSNSIRQAAQAILASMRRVAGTQTYVPADPLKFLHLDLGAYDRVMRELQARGFRLLADLELVEVSKSPTSVIAPTINRVMVSSDGRVVAEYYQVKPRIGRRIKLLMRGLANLRLIAAPKNFLKGMVTRHCTGFETEFADGRQLLTSNAESAGMLAGPPQLERKFFPYGTPAVTVLEDHMRRLAQITETSGIETVEARSLDEALAMQRRQHLLKAAYRKSNEWVSRAEIQAMSGGNPQLASEVFAEVRKLLLEEGAGAGKDA